MSVILQKYNNFDSFRPYSDKNNIMNSAVCFRDFEERDIDFIYKCKNNEKLWEYTVGDFHPFSYEEAVEWVRGCMRDDPTYKFWAICKNDETRDIVGWCSIANINYDTKTSEIHGLVIGDIEYNDGFTWIESVLFLLHYIFEVLSFRYAETIWRCDHPNCRIYNQIIDIKTRLCQKQNQDYVFTTISQHEYFELKNKGGFELKHILDKVYNYHKTHK